MLETTFKCRPTTLKSNIRCEQESLGLDCTQSPGTRLIIANARFTKNSRSLSYCGPSFFNVKEVGNDNCDDLVMTDEAGKICNGKVKCSFLADPVTLAILAGQTLENKY